MSDANNEGLDFRVRRDDWSRCEFVTNEVSLDPPAGGVLFRVDRFALTANNITYAVAGDMLDYWGFFPADEGWGRIPVMGFADVLASSHPAVAVGERVFGFFPMSRHLLIEAEREGESVIIDASPHRSAHALFYRQYTPVASDPLYQAVGGAEREDALMIFRGLFMTSFLADDYLAESDFGGAREVVVISASSKTAIALAWALSRRDGVSVTGLTSPGNREFVEGLGCYDKVVTYDALDEIDDACPLGFVDMAGNAAVLRSLHERCGDNVKFSLQIGVTHWQQAGDTTDMPGAVPEFFFAPTQAERRLGDWGGAGFQERVGGALAQFLEWTDGWLQLRRGSGPEAMERVYRDTLEGRVDPSVGRLLSPWD